MNPKRYETELQIRGVAIFSALSVIGLLLILVLFSGCTSSSPPTTPPTSTPSSPPPTTLTVTTVPTLAFPNALSIGQYANFGIAPRTGKATIYHVEIRPDYNWTEPSFNSVREQNAAFPPFSTEYGYNIARPKIGNTFLFIYVKMIGTGSEPIYVPSPPQFVVYSNGTTYNFTSVNGPDVLINGIYETQYDIENAASGIIGYVDPGENNGMVGYLIYEVPATISLKNSYALVSLNLTNQGPNTTASWSQAAWRLG